jgi:hypothetical protein
VWSHGREEDRSNKKGEKKDEEEEQLEEGNLLQPNPYKHLMVVEVCCYCQELSIAAKVCCLGMEFLIWFF